MKYVHALLLGLGAVVAPACQAGSHAAEVRASTVTLAITGMT